MDGQEIFSDGWARKWAHALNASPSYRQAAADWRWPLIVSADGVSALYLDLHEGSCRSVRRASDEDTETADFVIGGPVEVWEAILRGEGSPLVAVMRGRLRLEKGSYTTLARYSEAARHMLDAAVSITPVNGSDSGATEEAKREASREPEATQVGRSRFRTTSASGLDLNSFPMQLYRKAKKLGVWDPEDIDFSRDRSDWDSLTGEEQDVLLRLISMFQAGEEAVTLDLLPLMRVVAAEGRIEEEMYLTTFLFEEAKHTEFFRRFMDEVVGARGDLDHYHTPAYRRLFYDELPRALDRLNRDTSAEAQLEAAATYNMVVEGTLAETGYHGLYEILDRRRILPGLRTGTTLLQRDESRHIAFGVYLISRLIGEDRGLMSIFERRMNVLLPIATGVISELFGSYDPMPFDLREEDFLKYATDQFSKRMVRIESGGVKASA